MTSASTARRSPPGGLCRAQSEDPRMRIASGWLAYARRRFRATKGCDLRVKGDFQHTVTLMAEELKRLDDVVESKAMCHKRRQIDPTLRDHRHEAPHALFAARTEGRDNFLIAETCIERIVGCDHFPGVHAKTRQSAAGARRSQRVFERFLLAKGFDRH